MSQCPAPSSATTTRADKATVDTRWMPKDCDGQMKMGFSIIANAFKLKVKALEEELTTVNHERGELQKKLEKMEGMLATLHRERLESSMLQCQINDLNEKLIEKTVELNTATNDHEKREQELLHHNRRLAEMLRQYKKKVSQLETFRRVVVDTVKHEDTLDCADFSDKPAGKITIEPYRGTSYEQRGVSNVLNQESAF